MAELGWVFLALAFGAWAAIVLLVLILGTGLAALLLGKLFLDVVYAIGPKTTSRFRLSPVAQAEIRCAFCHDAVRELEGLACRVCSTVLHEGCWSESERCPVLGCARARERERRRA